MDVVGPVWWGWGGQSRSAAEFLDIRVWGENWWKEFNNKFSLSFDNQTVFSPSLAIPVPFPPHAQTVRSSFILELASILFLFFISYSSISFSHFGGITPRFRLISTVPSVTNQGGNYC